MESLFARIAAKREDVVALTRAEADLSQPDSVAAAIGDRDFDLLLMVAFGVLGYVLRKLNIPTVPVILGILLGGHMETALRRAMVLSNGEWTYLFSSPIAIGLWTAAILGFIAPIFLRTVLSKPSRVPD